MWISNMENKSKSKNRGMSKMITALNVANNILLRGFNDNIDITPMKLQKLIYFVYKEYLKVTKKPLFNERFEVWKYGPVVRTVYDEFKTYRANRVSDYYREGDHTITIGDEENSKEFKKVLDKVWERYKNQNGLVLSQITHKQGSAWRNALDQNKYYLDDNDILGEEVSD